MMNAQKEVLLRKKKLFRECGSTKVMKILSQAREGATFCWCSKSNAQLEKGFFSINLIEGGICVTY